MSKLKSDFFKSALQDCWTEGFYRWPDVCLSLPTSEAPRHLSAICSFRPAKTVFLSNSERGVNSLADAAVDSLDSRC